MSEKLAAGLRSLPDAKSSFASTQAAWRFYRNERTCVATLAQPLLMEAHKGIAERCDKYALCVHDWSMVNFGKHQSKLDRKQRTHKNDIGYELQTALLLLSNVWDVDAKTTALWYYWRWRIESFFKLLKQAGHQLESWQQESGLALAKRLLIASMACVVVWQVAHSELPAAKEIQSFLVKLSGRQMKRSKPVTWSALLAGFWSLLSMLEVIENYSVDELHQFRNLLRKTSSAFAKLVPE
ncbi:hypothetical protein [Thioflexithrix psekupsensis]